MKPDRIALFGYAHVPWMTPHQRLIDETVLPSAGARLQQSQAAAERLVAAGYQPIGIDHFALPSDTLAKASRAGTLHRNFQGYTTDAAPALLGIGASSIGSLPLGYVQNVTATGEYIRRIADDGLAIARGIGFAGEDRLRAWVIERLMCDFAVSLDVLRDMFGAAAEGVVGEMLKIWPRTIRTSGRSCGNGCQRVFRHRVRQALRAGRCLLVRRLSGDRR